MPVTISDLGSRLPALKYLEKIGIPKYEVTELYRISMAEHEIKKRKLKLLAKDTAWMVARIRGKK